MRSRVGFIAYRAQAAVNEQGPATTIILLWKERAGTVTTDTVTGSISGGTVTNRQSIVKGFFHTITPAVSAARMFNETEVGNAIVDFEGTVELDGKENLRFSINGEVWVQKEISDVLAKSWEVIVAGKRLWRSVLLRKAT
jgi:hypothetical protein